MPGSGSARSVCRSTGPRHAGRPKFTLGKLFGLALDGLVGFSEAPLRWAGGLGGLGVVFALAGLAGAGVRGCLGGGWAPGWLWVGLLVLFSGGAQLLFAAILGEYVSRIFQEVNGRPLYVVRRRIGLKPRARPGAGRRSRSPVR